LHCNKSTFLADDRYDYLYFIKVKTTMICHITRRGKEYYLYEGKTKTGNPKYFFSMKSEGNSVDAIPDGYEIYENPNSQVFLRRIPPQIITLEEVEKVKVGIKKYAKTDYFIVDVKGKNIIVNLADQDVDLLVEMLSPQDSLRARDVIIRSLSYSPMMQFVLKDAVIREFAVERWCFLGAVDGWIWLDQSTDLSQLVKKYGSHLGTESFYDLR
jgi:hypothetical protein